MRKELFNALREILSMPSRGIGKRLKASKYFEDNLVHLTRTQQAFARDCLLDNGLNNAQRLKIAEEKHPKALDWYLRSLHTDFCEYCETPIIPRSLFTINKHRFCSCSCSARSDTTNRRKQETSLANWGTEFPSQNRSVMERIREAWNSKSTEELGEIRSKREKTCLLNNGVRHGVLTDTARKAVATKESRDRQKIATKEANLKLYGTLSPFHREEIQSKVRETKMERYGDEYWNNPEKTKRTAAGRSSEERERVRSNIASGCLASFGYQSPFHDPEIQTRAHASLGSHKEITIDGIVFPGLRGYEPQCVKFMKSMGWNLERMSGGFGCGKFQYVGEDTKTHWYFPDFRCKIQGQSDIFIEVKSEYTLKMGLEDGSLKKKIRAVQNAGHPILLLVLNSKGKVLKSKRFLPKYV